MTESVSVFRFRRNDWARRDDSTPIRHVAIAALLLAFLIPPANNAFADHGGEHAGPELGGAGSGLSAVDALKQIGLGLIGGGAPEFLPPDEAFVLEASAASDATAIVRWKIAQGYYLYRERFQFAATQPPGTSIGSAVLPPGEVKEDAYFGRMEVFYDRVEARIPIELPAVGPRNVQLDVSYQGCADAGLCYPPITKTVALVFAPPSPSGTAPSTGDASPARPAGTAEPAGDLPEQDRLARALATNSTGLVLLAFFGLGLLLTFTPCVLPMIPILSSIIVGQGDGLTTRRAFGLSLTYVLAMSATYTAAGIAAGLSGANLQAAFQSPWILIVFSGVFVLLALSMFGLYDLQIPIWLQQRLARLSNRQRGGTYAGVGVMGFLSALIVGPCVAAPLAGALIYIARTGDAWLGGAALFALSLGMGAPVLAIGTSAGRLVPRAGAWMRAVKASFGFILLGVAIYLLERLLPGAIALLLWATLLAAAGICLLIAGRGRPPRHRSRWAANAASALAFGYGALLLVGAASGGEDLFRPLDGLHARYAGERGGVDFRAVKGLAELDAELRLAVETRRPVMLDFYADWCVSCKELERYTFSDPAVKAVLSQAVLLRTDVTANDAEDQALLERFGLFGPPAILFFGPDGAERPGFRVVGYMAAEPFRALAERGLFGAGPTRALRRAGPARKPGDA